MDISRIKQALAGPVPSVSTPFLENGDIDWASLDRIVDFLIENGAGTLLLTYGDSLMSVMTDRELGDFTKAVVRAAAGRAMVIACGKPWCCRQTLEFIAFAREAGADVGIPVAADWAQSAGVEECAALVREAGRVMPVMALTSMMNGRGFPMEAFRRLVGERAPGFAGVKDDMCGPYGRRLAALMGGEYAFLSGGRAENHLDVAPYGADGYLSIFMRFMPNLAREYWRRYEAGDMKACARWIGGVEIPFMDFIAANGYNFDAAIHGLMERAGLCGRWRRAPYASISEAQAASLWEFCRGLGRANVI